METVGYQAITLKTREAGIVSAMAISRHLISRGVYYQQDVCAFESSNETRVEGRGSTAVCICLAHCSGLNVLDGPRLHGLVVLV